MRQRYNAALVLCLSCGPEAPSAPLLTDAMLVGAWTLQAYNGASLPVVIYQDSTRTLRLVSDVITFFADETDAEAALSTLSSSSGQVFNQGGHGQQPMVDCR